MCVCVCLKDVAYMCVRVRKSMSESVSDYVRLRRCVGKTACVREKFEMRVGESE